MIMLNCVTKSEAILVEFISSGYPLFAKRVLRACIKGEEGGAFRGRGHAWGSLSLPAHAVRECLSRLVSPIRRFPCRTIRLSRILTRPPAGAGAVTIQQQ
jgi:hypothetical protein